MKMPYRSTSASRGSSHDAGVVSYEVFQDGAGRDVAVALEFRDAEFRYLYDVRVPGAQPVAEMIRLAKVGKGLSTYVNQHVREKYSARVPL